MHEKPKIIGVAGTFASGQDTVAKHLRDKFGYLWFSTSDAVRKVSQQRHGSIERPDLAETATFLRDTRGGGVLAEIGIEELENSDNTVGVVISGIRTMGELKAVVNAGGVMIFTDADDDLRYKRMVARQRDAESALSQKEFQRREAVEYHAGETDADFNRRDIKAFAAEKDMVLLNNDNLEDFLRTAEERLGLA